MPFAVPSLAETRAQSRDDVAAALEVDALPGNSPARILADANGGLAYENFEYLVQLADELLPDRARRAFLLRWAAIYGLPVGAATFAEGIATASGIAGTVLPASQELTAGGLRYATTEQITVGVSPTPVGIRALDAGLAGNLAAGTALALTVAVSGLDASAVVTILTGGVDEESTDGLRDRVLARIRKPPMGGDADDYVAWARAVPGVTRAWCAPSEMGPGTVTVRFMMDELRATSGGFPTADDEAAVRAYLDERRPVTVQDFYAFGPVARAVNVTINGLSPNTAATRAAVIASLKAMLRERAAPARAVNGLRVPAQTIHEEWISAAILEAAGVDHFDLQTGDQAMANNGNLAVLGTVTFGA